MWRNDATRDGLTDYGRLRTASVNLVLTASVQVPFAFMAFFA